MSSPRSNILIIEDDADIAEAIVVALTMEGYGVRVVTSRNDALRVLSMYLYDCVIMDYSMNGMTAEEFISALSLHMRSKIILVSAISSPQEVAERLKIKAWLKKPFEISTLMKVVQVTCGCT